MHSDPRLSGGHHQKKRFLKEKKKNGNKAAVDGREETEEGRAVREKRIKIYFVRGKFTMMNVSLQ